MCTFFGSICALSRQNLTKDEIFKANTLGWCIEWVSGAVCVVQLLSFCSNVMSYPI